MLRKHEQDMNAFLLEVHRKGLEQAVERSIRTGVPLVVEKNGVIQEIKPKYKYVRVLVDEWNDSKKNK